MSEIDPRFKKWAAERGLPEGYEDWRLARDAWDARGEHDKAERDAQGPENPVRDAALKELGSMIHPNTSGTSCTRIDQEMLEGYEQIAKHGYPSESSPPVKLAAGSHPVIHPADWMKPAPLSLEERIERLEKIHNLTSHAEK